ncbi:MAG: hypothetical protein AAB797_03065 [Patescibacteria group bacterium]
MDSGAKKTGMDMYLGGLEKGKMVLGVKLLNGCCEMVKIGKYYLESNKIVVLVQDRLLAKLIQEGSLNDEQAERLRQTMERQSVD